MSCETLGSSAIFHPLVGVGSALLLSALSPVLSMDATAGPLTERPCLRGVEPSASLLIPYFEVDLDSSEGITTLIGVTNTLAQPVLAKVVLWSDWALPVGAFNVYLTGFDVQTLNLRDVLAGRLPSTGAAASPVGDRSDPNAPFPGCDSQNVTGAFDAGFVRAALRGDPVDGACWSSPEHPGRAVGYVTVDVVQSCSPLLPPDDGYFGPGDTGVAANTNALLGDFFLVEPGENFAQGDTAVHLVADADFFGPGDDTFYGEYVDMDGSDARIPLPRAHGVRFLRNEGFDGGSEILVWRDVSEPGTGPVACGGDSRLLAPPWLRSSANVVSFDEEENSARLGGPIDPAVFLQATQRVSAEELSPWQSGWLQLDLFDQGWVSVVMRAFDRFSVGLAAGHLVDPCGPRE